MVLAVTPAPEIEGAGHQGGQKLDIEVEVPGMQFPCVTIRYSNFTLDPASLLRALFLFACSIVAWLHLRHCLSRSAAGVVLKAMDILVVTGMSIGARMAGQPMSSSTHPAPRFSLPHDVRTAMSTLSIEPNVIRSVCCPKCFPYQVRKFD